MCVLILVDQNIFETLLILLQHIAIPLQYREHVKQQIAEIAGIERTQTILILPVHFLSPAIGIGFALAGIQQFRRRSEEHTSELQSLMRTSYAVFCLKKKKP